MTLASDAYVLVTYNHHYPITCLGACLFSIAAKAALSSNRATERVRQRQTEILDSKQTIDRDDHTHDPLNSCANSGT